MKELNYNFLQMARVERKKTKFVSPLTKIREKYRLKFSTDGKFDFLKVDPQIISNMVMGTRNRYHSTTSTIGSMSSISMIVSTMIYITFAQLLINQLCMNV